MQLDFLIDSQPLPRHPLPQSEGMIQMIRIANVKHHARELERLASAVEFASKHLDARATVQQLLVFLRAAEAEAMGQSITVADIRERDGLGPSVGRSYQIFLEPSRQFPDGLGWLRLEEDADDRRRKTLKLTPNGTKVAAEMAMRLR